MRRCRQFGQLIVPAVVIGLVLVLTAYKAEQNAARQARFHERDVKQKAALELGREVNERVRMAFKAGLTLTEFAEAFRSSAELTEVKDPKHANATHSLFHEESQRTFYLRFQDGRLVGISSNHGTSDVDTGVVLETPAFLRSESVRASILSAGLVAWCVILVAGIRIRQSRWRVGVLLVIVSMVCGLCWFLAPNYSPTWRGVTSNDNLAIFVLLLIASLGFGMTTARRGQDADETDRIHDCVAH